MGSVLSKLLIGVTLLSLILLAACSTQPLADEPVVQETIQPEELSKEQKNREEIRERSSSISENFDQVVFNYQKIVQRLDSLYNDLDLATNAQIRQAKGYSDEIEESVGNIERNINELEETILWLEGFRLTNDSYAHLDAVESVNLEYLESLEIVRTIQESTNAYLAYFELEVEYDNYLDSFFNHYDLQEQYVEESKFDSALKEVDKAIPFQEQMMEVRETQLPMAQYGMNFVQQQYDEEIAYTAFIEGYREELQSLEGNPNIPSYKAFLKSDELYEEYNEIYLTEAEYLEALDEWLFDNVFSHRDRLKDELAVSGLNQNRAIGAFQLKFAEK